MSRDLIKSKSCVVSVCLLSSMIHSTMVNANEIKNQNLSNPSGTTIHSNWHTVLLNSGGPYTINNAGTITVTNQVELMRKLRQTLQIPVQLKFYIIHQIAEGGYRHIRRQAQALLLIVV